MYNVPFEKLNDAKMIEQVCVDACKIEGVKVLNTYTHQFEPQGVTCNLTLGESHPFLPYLRKQKKGCVCLRYFHLWSEKSTLCSMVDTGIF